jgi:hypothetical protein
MSNWVLPPPRTGRAPLTHPAPHGGHHDAISCIDLQVGSVSIVDPAQCPDDALPKCLHRSAAFPPPELPGFIGTMQPSDFPAPSAFLAFSACTCILVSTWLVSTSNKSFWDLTGCPVDMMCSANGPSTPGLQMPLANDATTGVAFQHLNALGRIRKLRDFGAQYHSRAGSEPVHSSSLPSCVRFNMAVTRHAATLDTGPVANGYPGGVPTRLSSNHFQYALAIDGYLPAFQRFRQT